jgi:hypothetical protein
MGDEDDVCIDRSLAPAECPINLGEPGFPRKSLTRALFNRLRDADIRNLSG